MRSLSLSFFLASSVLAGEPLPTPVSNLTQLWQVFSTAKRVSVSGSVPPQPLRLPVTLTRQEDIRALALLLRAARFELDSSATAAVRRGEAFATAVQLEIVIDGRFSFSLFGTNAASFANGIYFATRRENLSYDVAKLLGARTGQTKTPE